MSRNERVASVAAAVVATLAVAAAPTPPGLSPEAQYALATAAFAAVLWVTGGLPLPVTALAVPVLLSVFGVFPTVARALSGFADPVVFLLLAGFALAAALRAHGVDRRVAYVVLSRVGGGPRRLVAAVMATTAVLSMVVSNTATTAMMVPVSVGVAREVTARGDGDSARPSNVEVSMLLGTAYAASVGGVGTLVGTPPNAVVAGALRRQLGVDVTFVEWLAVGLPVVVVSLPVVWVVLTFVAYPPGRVDASAACERARRWLAEAGDLDAAGRRAVAVFAATVGLWVLGGFGFAFEGVLPRAWFVTLFGGPGESAFGTVGHQGALYYVVVGLAAVPALVASDAAEWDDLAAGIDWGTLVLLGGGLALADALSATGATDWLAGVLLDALAGAPLVVVLGAIVSVTILVGELASNTAMAAVLAPLLVSAGGSYADALGTTPTVAAATLAVTGAVAASFGFALPVATPPNAIVYGSGRVGRREMLRAGVVLDVVLAAVVTLLAFVLARTVWPAVLG